MEGSCTRTYPRTELDKPVELLIGKNTIWIENPTNNLSVGELYVCRGDLPVGSPVHVRIPVNHHFFEADGQIREASQSGTAIGFTSLSAGNREALYDLIADLTLRGLPAA